MSKSDLRGKRDDRGNRNDRRYWFAPKVYGFGVTPVTWQGWAVTLGFAALFVADLRYMPEAIARIGVAVALAVLFAVIVSRKTEGGWSGPWGMGK